MFISNSVLSILALSASSLAGPIHSRSLLSEIKGDLQNATIGGVANTIKQTVSNPALTLARVEVVKGLKDTGSAISAINATGNADVAPFVAQGATGLQSAQKGVDNIGQALVSNSAPSSDDQKAVAEGIKAAQDAIQCMSTAAKGDAKLTAALAQATTAVGGLRAGGEGVLKASNKSFTDLGLPADFDTSAPDCSGSGAAAGNSTASAGSGDASAAAGNATSTSTGDASANSTSTDTGAGDASADSGAAAAGKSTSTDAAASGAAAGSSAAASKSTSTDTGDAAAESGAAEASDASADSTADASDATSADASST